MQSRESFFTGEVFLRMLVCFCTLHSLFTLLCIWESLYSFERLKQVCVCVLEQWDLINGESKADWSRHSSKQSQSNRPPSTACRSSQQIKNLMDIDQIPSNKPTAIILSQPPFAFLAQSVCVRAQSQGFFSRRTVSHSRRCFGGK